MGKKATKIYFGVQGLTRNVIKDYINNNYKILTLDSESLEEIRVALNVPKALAEAPNQRGKTDMYHAVYNICYAVYDRDNTSTSAAFVIDKTSKVNKEKSIEYNFSSIEDAQKMLDALSTTTDVYSNIKIII